MRHDSGCSIEPLESRRLLSSTISAVAGTTIVPVASTLATSAAIGTPFGVTIHAEATDKFSGTVGILKNFALPPSPLTPTGTPVAVGLQVSINWGDGSKPSAGGLVSGPVTKEFLVKGSHTYAKPGTFKITVSILWGPLPGSKLMIPTTILDTIHSTAIVAKDDDGGVTLSETAGKSFTAPVGSFDFRSVDLVLSATIDWGDGTHSVGKIVGNFATGEYQVVGTHTFAKAGTYILHVKVLSHVVGAPPTMPSGTAAQWTSTINVHNPA